MQPAIIINERNVEIILSRFDNDINQGPSDNFVRAYIMRKTRSANYNVFKR